ncbi:hypothetical protein MTO96_049741 [Rhipicephalus appendiculatus]
MTLFADSLCCCQRIVKVRLDNDCPQRQEVFLLGRVVIHRSLCASRDSNRASRTHFEHIKRRMTVSVIDTRCSSIITKRTFVVSVNVIARNTTSRHQAYLRHNID